MATLDPGQRRRASKMDALKRAIASGAFKPPKKIAPRIPRLPRPKRPEKLPWPPRPGRKRPGLEKLPYPLPKKPGRTHKL